MSTSVVWDSTTYSVPSSGEINWASLNSFLIALGSRAGVAKQSVQAVRKAIATPISVSASTDYAIAVNMTTPSAVTVNLPAGVAGQIFLIVDDKGDAGTNTITINRNGADTIAGGTSTTMTHNREAVILIYNSSDTDWKIVRMTALAGTITNSDVASNAAISFSKLAALTSAHILVGSAGNVATDVAVSGDITMANTGAASLAATISNAKTWNDVQTWKCSSGATTTGSYDTAGAWVHGPTTGVTTYQLEYGSVVSRVTSASGSGSYAAPSATYFSANTYLDSSGTEKAVISGTGYSYVQVLATTTATNPVFTLYANTTSQTAGSGTTGSATACVQILANGSTTFGQIHNVGSGNIRSGTSTPTLTNTTNISSSTANGEQYMRVGNVVTVSGTLDLTITTAAGTASEIAISLPVASNFTTGNQCSGTVSVTSGVATGYSSGYITSDSTNDRARVSFNALASGARTMQYHYTYQVL